MLVGRDAERAEIDRLLERASRGRSGALVIRGEVGIGKSALLEYAASRAGDARVLHALGVETESEFAFSGLHELVHPLLERLGELPPVQAAALRGALALTEAQGVGRLYIGAATLSLLAAAREDATLVCLVDDAHWLDQASADALMFAARRLEAEGIAMLFAARGSPDEGFRATGIPVLELHGLDVESAAALIEGRLSFSPPCAVVEALVAATGGNPLALHELAPRLTPEQLTGVEPLPHPLPVGSALRDAFAAQAEELSEPAREALVLAATADTRTLRVVTRAGELSRSALEECEAAGLIRIADGELSFIHPLIRSAVYQQASPSERRRAHRVLADAFAGEEPYAERRAWHLAAATVEADEAVADELEQAADAARVRRGHIAAAAMFERAARLTPATDPRARRLFLAAKSAWLAGQPDRALRLLEGAAVGTTDNLLRADIQLLRGRIELRCGILQRVDDLVAEATRVEPVDAGRAALMLATSAEGSAVGSRLELAGRAASLAAGRGDVADLLSQLALARALLESRNAVAASESLERAKTMLAENQGLRQDPELILAVVEALASLDDADEALVRELLQVATVAARSHAVVVLPRALLHAAWLDFERGHWTDAYLNFFESSRLADETGQARERKGATAGRALLDALQGRAAESRKAAAELTELAPLPHDEASASAARILGLIELGEGRGDAASVHFEQAIAGDGSSLLLRGLPDPRVDLVEAYLRAGRSDEARKIASEESSKSTGRSNSAAWMNALLSDTSSSETAFQKASLPFGQCPFLLARVQLNSGESLRRAGERRSARDQLRAALALFESLGATPWTERVHQELRASGETLRRREPNTLEALTPQELQVARVVAAGATYKEAAAKLFLSPKTIEYHLGKVYRKLGISSGRQLTARLAEEGLWELT